MTHAIRAIPAEPGTYGSDEERWAAVLQRDKKADGAFYFSVATTGVYCRPSCAARRALRENVRFHATPADAEAAGFRPCKRCYPDQPTLAEQQSAAIERACRDLEATDGVLDLDGIARAAGMSRFHFQRVFKTITGVTPKAYFAGCRMRKIQDALKERKTVTEAIYEAGFQSSGRFYESSAQMLGMRPTIFRSGGDSSVVIQFAVGECSLGSILVAATGKGVCCILLGGDPGQLIEDLERRFPRAELRGGDAAFEQQVARVIGFVEDPRQGLDLALDVRGTAFQQRVWQALRDIPAGSTASYQELAERVGSRRAVRAVAGACAANALAVAIPCHRVIRKDGDISGYRWGVERKQALLERERVAAV